MEHKCNIATTGESISVITSTSTAARPQSSIEIKDFRCFFRKAKILRSSLARGIILCAVASLLNVKFLYEGIFSNDSRSKTTVLISLLWYIGACSGSIVCGCNNIAWSARETNFTFGFVLLASYGVSTYFKQILEAFCVAHFLVGFSYGFVYITLLTQIADNFCAPVRGFATVLLSLTETSCLGLCVCANIYPTISIIFILIYLISSFITTWFYTCDPITRVLHIAPVDEAYEMLKHLYGDSVDESFIVAEIIEKRKMISEDYGGREYHGCFYLLSDGNERPLFLMIILRILGVLTSHSFIIALLSTFDLTVSFMALVLLTVGVQFSVLLIPQNRVDKWGRKPLLIVSGIGCAFFYYLFTASVLTNNNIDQSLPIIAIIVIHIFAALGILPLRHIYSVEAFPLLIRNASLSSITCCEYILQMLATWYLYKSQIRLLLKVSPYVILLLTILAYIQLPETKGMPLRKCRDKFNKTNSAVCTCQEDHSSKTNVEEG